MRDNNAHINYSFADIERYLNGGMTAKEMHDMERAALQDPFLADAIDGYRTVDATTAGNHLNEIAALLQKEEPAKVLPMPKKKKYSWLVAASVLLITGTGVFLFTSRTENQLSLAENAIKRTSPAGAVAEDTATNAPSPDSPAPAPPELALTKPKEETKGRLALAEKKKPQPTATQTTPEAAPQQETSPDVARAYSAPLQYDKAIAEPKPSAPVLQDSAVVASGLSLSQANVNESAKRRAKLVNVWTNDKGKPFLLSDVEVINLGKKETKKADTTSVKPEGGWQLFQDYLFSRLSRQDSLLLVNSKEFRNNLELEFSIDDSGSPYDIKVLHAQDTTVTNKIINAVQSGPKWTSPDKKEKRLRLRY